MIRRTVFALAALAALGLGSDARAAQLFDFSSSPVVPAGGTDTIPGVVSIVYSPNAGTSDAGFGPVDIKVSFVDLFVIGGSGPVVSPFTFDIGITDQNTGGSDVFTLSGSLFGTVGPTASSLDFTWSGSVSKILSGPGGSVMYTVSAKFVDVPTVLADGTGQQGSITATVTATPVIVPEPSTLAMLGVGGLGLIGTIGRRKFSRRGKLA